MLAVRERAMIEGGHSALIRVQASDDAARYSETLAALDPLWQTLYHSLSDEGSLWVIASNIYIDGQLYPVPLDLAHRTKATTGFKLKNILVVYRESHNKNKPFNSAYFNILFFVKSLTKYYFNKDAVREPHIFKDIEWGKRKVGSSGYSDRISTRYSEKGRDPGNVWYKADRTREGNIVKVYGYDDAELYSKLIELSTGKNWTLTTNISDNSFLRTANKLGRKVKMVST